MAPAVPTCEAYKGVIASLQKPHALLKFYTSYFPLVFNFSVIYVLEGIFVTWQILQASWVYNLASDFNIE